MVLYPGTSACVGGRADTGCGNRQDAIPDARAKEAWRLSRIRLRIGDDLHRRERGCGVVGAGWRLVLHVDEIVDEIVICDKFVFNELTILVDNRVGVHSHWRLGSCLH